MLILVPDRKRYFAMEELIKSLSTVVRAIDNSPELDEAAALAAWKYVAGEGLRNHAAAIRLEGKNLIVAVRDTVWQKQMTSMKSQLLFRINSMLGRPILQNIEWQIQPDALKQPQTERHPVTEVLDNEVPIDLWSAASTIADKQLRQKFLKTAMAALKRRE